MPAKMKGTTIKRAGEDDVWKQFRRRAVDADRELGVYVGMETATTTTGRLHTLHDKHRKVTFSESA